ncbi:MAG: iron ABC transporter permease, partial [Alicyclobacillaceae bacterium]|nr:iron ABC transporter permease [Alicyclobacillaceae bacterium]
MGTAVLGFLAVASVVASVCIGQVSLSSGEVWRAVVARALGRPAGLPEWAVAVVWNIRLPRAILAL